MRAPLLTALLLTTGCNVPLVHWGQNPVTGCATDSDCPLTSTCTDGGCTFTVRLCMNDNQCDLGQRCNMQDYCVPADFEYCHVCISNPDCDSGICAQFGDGGPICAASCDACPSSGSCQQLLDGTGGDAGMACLPTSGSCP